MSKKAYRRLSVLLFLLLLLSGCAQPDQEAVVPALASPAPAAPPPEPASVTLAAVGDNILHNTVYQSAQTASGYDFLPLYQPVASLIAQADIAFVNQEPP